MRELAAAPGMRSAKRTEQPIAPRSHLAAQACQSPRAPSILRVGPCSWLAMSASRTRASLRRGKSHARADQVSHTLAGYLRCRSSSPPGPAIVGAARYLFMLPRPLDTNLIAQRPTQARATRADAQGPNSRHGAGRFLGSSWGAPPTSWPVSKHRALGARCAQTLMPMPCASSV